MKKNIQSLTMAFDQIELVDKAIEKMYNDPKRNVLSHSIALSDDALVVNFIYKPINDVDVG